MSTMRKATVPALLGIAILGLAACQQTPAPTNAAGMMDHSRQGGVASMPASQMGNLPPGHTGGQPHIMPSGRIMPGGSGPSTN
jgi:hypothetical protein